MLKVGLLRCQRAAGVQELTHDSQIWYGKAPSLTHATRPSLVQQMVLGKSLGLLLGTMLCEALDPVAIPSHFPTDNVPQS